MNFILMENQRKAVIDLLGTSNCITEIEGVCRSYLLEKERFKNYPSQGPQNKSLWQLREKIHEVLNQFADPLTQPALEEYCGHYPDFLTEPTLTKILDELGRLEDSLSSVEKPHVGRPKGGGVKKTESSMVSKLYDICTKTGNRPTIINNDTYRNTLFQLVGILQNSPALKSIGSLEGVINDVIKWRKKIALHMPGEPIDLSKALHQKETDQH